VTDFKAKMHQIRFRLGLSPRPRWGSLQRSRRPHSWIWRPLRGRGRGGTGEEEGKERGRGGEGEGKGGPPSYCWTTDPQSLATPLEIGSIADALQSVRFSISLQKHKLSNRPYLQSTPYFHLRSRQNRRSLLFWC